MCNFSETIADAKVDWLVHSSHLIEISLGRELWNIVDAIVGAGLIISVINESEKSKKN